MFRNEGESPGSSVPPDESEELPAPLPLAFATLWCSGPDPRRDVLLRLQALRIDVETGTWETFSAWIGNGPDEALATVARDFDLQDGGSAGAGSAATAFADYLGFLRGSAVITAAREPFLAWARALACSALDQVHLVDLPGIAALISPGRDAADGLDFACSLLGADAPRLPRALEPAHLRAALGILVGRVLRQEEAVLALLPRALGAARLRFEQERDAYARTIALVLQLCDRPSSWKDPDRALEPENAFLEDQRLSDASRAFPTLEDALSEVRPAWGRAASEERSREPLAVRVEEERTLDAADRRIVDEIFREHLPRHFAEHAGARGAVSYRPAQHAVAAVIAEGFGSSELRLVHAPTGTGKTLAYLVPVALWAYRNDVRVGVATFTRALQEQALEREAPLATALLESAGGARGIRIHTLKGRENYLCWRALSLRAPRGDEPAEEILAWTSLALFGARDPDGDLDRFAPRSPIPDLTDARWRAVLEPLLRSVRSESGCCSLASDRANCGAEAALRRAERSHVVITNHALALARPAFFQHLVFDECEHLHDVAHNAFSFALGARALRELLGRLHGSDGRRPLDRVASLAPPGSEAAVLARACREANGGAQAELEHLVELLRSFKIWRSARIHVRPESDHHSLFREYVEGPEAAELLLAHSALTEGLAGLGASLMQIQESLDPCLPPGEAPRLRRALELLRAEIAEAHGAIASWIPRDEADRPRFREESFHDLEQSSGGEDVFSVRVLLPHEVLGRHYLPSLAGAVFLSATTWLKGGFEASAAYLGLQRAADPDSDEERGPCVVRTFRAPETFDYSRVLVAVPRDTPSVHDKDAFLRHVARFLAFLGERTRGRLLALFTNAEDLAQVGVQLEPFFAERFIPFWWQRMKGTTKEQLGERFRSHVDSVLLGLDTFWYGADFPGSTLEYLVLVRLPYGVPDDYYHAQCAALGPSEQRRTIYMPRALAKFRQGFGRLMRKESDKGCVFVLDKRILDPRHRIFMRELPLHVAGTEREDVTGLAPLVNGDTDRCMEAALAHMDLSADVRRRDLERSFSGWQLDA